jgi:hypothetical protein
MAEAGADTLQKLKLACVSKSRRQVEEALSRARRYVTRFFTVIPLAFCRSTSNLSSDVVGNCLDLERAVLEW